MHKLPPVISTYHSPEEAIGHDYEAFCRIYQKYYLAREAARSDNRSFAGKFKDDEDALIFRSALKKLEAHGYVPMGLDDRGNPKFSTRLQSEVDLMFWDDNTYGGVPPMKELLQMTTEELMHIFRDKAGSIGQ